MSDKPGVMVYFDIWAVIQRMSNELTGILFKAIMEYGATKRVPELPDSLYIIWPMIQSRLDNDDERYYRVSQKKRYAIYTRWAKHKNEPVLPFDRWLTEYDRLIDEDELLS